jgi:lipid-binding SYLF domain-containing protein
MNRIAVILFAVTILVGTAAQAKDSEAVKRANKAATVFREIMAAPDKGVPLELLDHASCVAVFPSVMKGGFVVGGQYGKGVVSCRRDDAAWGSPAYFTIGGGSFGLQLGGQAVDLILIFMNQDGVQGLLKDKFEIGAGAAASAGPLGRNTHVSTDLLMKAQILSYSRSRGLFAGLELKGAVIAPDGGANRDVYGSDATAREIIVEGKVRTPPEIQSYPQTLSKFSPKKSR